MTKAIQCLLTLLLIAATGSAGAVELPRHDPVPGGIALVDLNIVSEQAPQVYFQKRRVMVLKNGKGWTAVVGLPLGLKSGQHKLKLKLPKRSSVRFKTRGKDYALRHITIPNQRMVSPGKADIERHMKEKPLITAALKTWTEQYEVPTAFILPVQGRLSSPFGLRRIYNKQDRVRRHTGLDIAAPVGTPIVAPARGKVIRTGDYFFTGGTVFLDHGQGLITMYCHMSKIEVKAGEVLEQGQRLGEVGMTGRVSGPHLHWVVSLNNTKVEPKLFLSNLETQQVQ